MPDHFTIVRAFDASREAVFDAWTLPEKFSVWFGTAAVAVPLPTLTMDVRVGGVWSAVMQLPDGSTKDWEGEYREVDRPSRLSLTLTDQPGADAGEPIVVVLDEAEGGTRMTFTQPRHGFTDEQVAMVTAGYNAFFDAMDEIVTGRSPSVS